MYKVGVVLIMGQIAIISHLKLHSENTAAKSIVNFLVFSQ